MPRKIFKRRSLSAISEINLTPLIDLAFSLLIIFMVTTPLLEQTISLNLPIETQQSQPNIPDLKFQIVSINAQEDVFWGKKNVSLNELDELLLSLSKESTPPILDIRAERTIPYQRVIDILSLVKKHQLTKINLDTSVQDKKK